MSRKPGVFTVLRACFIILRQAFWHCLEGAVTVIRLLDQSLHIKSYTMSWVPKLYLCKTHVRQALRMML